MTHLTTKINYVKPFIFVFFLVISTSLFSQTVSINDTSYNEEALVDLLFGETCISYSNSNFSSSESVGYFNNNGGDFPISEGVIIRNGFVRYTEGKYTGNNLDSQNSTNGDTDLQTITNNEGNTLPLTDAAFLEFEFTPIGDNFDFNYIFASNEYGEEQCDRADLFAIFLIDDDTGVTKNIATVPGTALSISVKNIRSTISNGNGCESVNGNLFSTYNLIQQADGTEIPDEDSTINMRGFTEILNASATVIPGNKYKLRFVIADYNDSDYDSAVFIEKGSFDGSLDLGEDKEICGGENITLDSGFSDITGYSHTWKKNGTVLSENGATLAVEEPGTYSLSLTNGSCTLEDEIIITGFTATKPDDAVFCTETSTINIFEEVNENQILNGLDSADFNITYHTSENDANNGVNQIADITSYTISSNNFTLWIRLSNTNYTDCFDIVSVNISIFSQPNVDSLNDVYECSQYQLPSLTNGNYYSGSGGTGSPLNVGDIITTSKTIYIYNNNGNCSNETSFTVNLSSDFDIEEEQCGSFEIPNTPLGKFYTQENGAGTEITAGTEIVEDTTIYFYSADCSISKEFDITINEIPTVEDFNNVITCGTYTFPALSNGSYYNSLSNGNGKVFSAGEELNRNQGVYIINENLNTGCSAVSYFYVYVIDPSNYTDIEECGPYTIPRLNVGNYYSSNTYTDENIIPEGSEITTSQKIYYYVETTEGTNCTDIEINVTINEIPQVDSLNNITHCENDLPILQPLNFGQYYTKSGGPDVDDQELLTEGSEISETQTIYIYNANSESCDSETSFTITIVPLPIIPSVFDQDINECETYTLPELEFGGNYYTESGGPNGTGIELQIGDAILESQTIYIYNESEELGGCYNEKSFFIEILETQVDVLEDVNTCNSSYVLQELEVGEYYTEPAGEGQLLKAGDIIDTTQTIYIYKDDPNFIPCQNESSFTVTMYTTPNLNTLPINLSSQESCGSVTLSSYSIPDIVVEYYRDEYFTDLIIPNELNEYTITEPGTRDIYIKVYPEGNSDCYVSDTISITVYPLLDFDIENGAICINPDNNTVTNPYIMDTKADPTYYDIKWYLDGQLLNSTSTSIWEATTPGTYTIEATVINPSSNSDCNYNTIDVIVKGSSPKFELNILSNNFSDSYSIEINTISEGAGEYVYAIDNGDFQTSNEFDNILPGTYNVTIRDLSGTCSDVILELIALDYQRFFTPNGDGVNDTWNINDLKNDLTATIEIYDRYGKLIDTIKTSGSGWDGLSNNGSKMQNTDYWFLLKYTKDGQQAVFRSHFSLLRK